MSDPTLQDLAVDLSTVERAEIARVLAELSHGRPHDLRLAFMNAAAGTAGDTDLSRLYRLLALAFEPQLRPDQISEPLGPFWTFGSGEQALSVSDLGPSHLALLQAAIDEALLPAFNARLADILWATKHGRGQDLRRHASTAVQAYLADAQLKQQGQDWPIAAKSLERALRLAHQLDRPPWQGLAKHARDATEALAGAFEAAQQWVGVLEARRLMHEFAISDPVSNAEACERSAIAAEAGGAHIVSEPLWEQAIASYRRSKDGARLEAAIMQAAELAVRQSESRESDSAGVAAHFLEAAVKQLRRLPSSRRGTRETELIARLVRLQERSLSEMKQVSAPFDAQEPWQRAEAAVSGKDLFDSLSALALLTRPVAIATLRKQVESDAATAVLMHMIPVELKGTGGKTVKRVGTLDADDAGDREAVMRYHMVSRANFHQNLIGLAYVEAARRTIAMEHRITINDLLPFMQRSGFVPAGREWQWAKALSAAFNEDFTAAMHLLVPQLEHALRMLLRNANVTCVAVDRLGQQEDWNLNHILLGDGREPAATILGEDAVFDLASLLVDRNGANFRNMVSHGLVDDGGLEGGLSRYLFWVCLRLCMIPLIARVEELRRAQDAAASPAGSSDGNASDVS